jgi:hypothetical protein
LASNHLPSDPKFDKTTVLQSLRIGISNFNSKVKNLHTFPHISSRTDVGVNALCNICSFDSMPYVLPETEPILPELRAH